MKKIVLLVLCMAMNVASLSAIKEKSSDFIIGFHESDENKSVTLFAHGLGGNSSNVHNYKVHRVIEGDAHSFSLYDSVSHVSLGQKHEMERLGDAIKQVSTEQPDAGIVLRGVSMGAVTITNYLGSSLYSGAVAIKGAILESPFAEVPDVLNVIIKRSTVLSALNFFCPCFHEIGVYFSYKNHNLGGIQPIKAACAFPKDIPVLLIASKEDTLIPVRSTSRIYDELVKSGHTKAHLLVVEHGKHANICWNNACSDMVRNVEHAFRKKYELGNYNDEYALAGQEAFALTQPSVNTLMIDAKSMVI